MLSLKLPIANWFFISFAHFVQAVKYLIDSANHNSKHVRTVSQVDYFHFDSGSSQVELIEINVTRLTNSGNYENNSKQEENPI